MLSEGLNGALKDESDWLLILTRFVLEEPFLLIVDGWLFTGSIIAIVLERWEEDLIFSIISLGSESLIRWLGTEII